MGRNMSDDAGVARPSFGSTLDLLVPWLESKEIRSTEINLKYPKITTGHALFLLFFPRKAFKLREAPRCTCAFFCLSGVAVNPAGNTRLRLWCCSVSQCSGGPVLAAIHLFAVPALQLGLGLDLRPRLCVHGIGEVCDCGLRSSSLPLLKGDLCGGPGRQPGIFGTFTVLVCVG